MKKALLTILALLFASMIACNANTTANNTFNTSSTIKIYTRDTTSGTRDAFFTGIGFSDAITDNTVLASGYVEVDGNGSMITSIKNDIYGIGYISLASLADSTLRGINFNGVEPTEANVLNETYDLKRTFNYMTRSDWTNMDVERQIIEAFVAYMGTTDGIAAINNKSGIVSASTSTPSWDDIKTNHPISNEDNSSVTIYFGGSTSVEGVARELSQEFSAKCGNFVAEHNHTGSGDAYKRTQGSEADGGNKIHIGFASREFKDTEQGLEGTYGFICYDAVVVVCNPANTTISTLTAAEVKQIYQGLKSTWSDFE